MDQLIAPRILAVGTLTLSALVGVYGTFSGYLQMGLVLPFLLAIPGLAWVSRHGTLTVLDLAVFSIGLTLAMETTIASILLVCGLWSTQATVGIMIGATAVGLACTWTHDR
jgi:hypothetical protein